MKSRNNYKPSKDSKKRMFIETTKNSILCKLVPNNIGWSRLNITPIASDFIQTKSCSKTQPRSEENFEILRRMNKLKFELREKQNKLKEMKEKCKDKNKRLKDRKK